MFNDRPKVPRQNFRPLNDSGCREFLAWAWALYAFAITRVQSNTAFLAYTFGLRHAVDPHHGTLPGCGDPSASASALPPRARRSTPKRSTSFARCRGRCLQVQTRRERYICCGQAAGLVRCANRLSRLLCRHTERVWRYHDAHYGGHRFGRHPWAKTFVFTALFLYFFCGPSRRPAG